MTICLIGNVDADSALCDRMTKGMYERLITHDSTEDSEEDDDIIGYSETYDLFDYATR